MFVSWTLLVSAIIDLAGLHDRGTLSGEPTVQRMFARRPDVIWFPHADYTGMVNALQSSSLLGKDYAYWPGAFDYGLAVRRGTAGAADVRQALRQVWQETYRTHLPLPSVRVR